MEPAIITAILNIGAVGMLGFFMLRTLPEMVEKWDHRHMDAMQKLLDDQAGERRAMAARLGAMVGSLDKMVGNMTSVYQYSIPPCQVRGENRNGT